MAFVFMPDSREKVMAKTTTVGYMYSLPSENDAYKMCVANSKGKKSGKKKTYWSTSNYQGRDCT